MAMVNLSFHSYCLGTVAHITVLLPEKIMGKKEDRSDEKFPVLYLLHGHSNDDMTYITNGNVHLLCRDLNLAVVMPACFRSFYTDAKHGYFYYKFVTEELPVMIHNYFICISTKREDTFIGGLSMGGYGAFKIAMSNPDKYAAAMSMSGAMDPVYSLRGEPKESPKCLGFTENIANIFGSPEEFDGSDNDLFCLVRELEKKTGPKPRFFATCGSEDSLLESNYRMEKVMKEETHLDYTLKVSPGLHNWFFWNKSIVDVLDFIGYKPVTDSWN